MDNLLNMEAFGEALRRRRKELRLTLDALSDATGISKPYLSNIETARAPGPPSAEKLSLLATALRLDLATLLEQADWLRTPVSIRNLLPPSPPRTADGAINLDAVLGAFSDPAAHRHPSFGGPTLAGTPGEIATGEPRGLDRTAVVPPENWPADWQPVPLARVPLINRVAAGQPSEFTDLDYPVGVADKYIPVPAGPAGGLGMFALRITGDSMEPLYSPGDIVVFSSHDTPHDGDDCLVRMDAGENFSTTFKRVFFAVENRADAAAEVRLVPLNPQHQQRLVSRDRISGIYPARWRVSPASRADGTSASAKGRKPRTGSAAAGSSSDGGKARREASGVAATPHGITEPSPEIAAAGTPTAAIAAALAKTMPTQRLALEFD